MKKKYGKRKTYNCCYNQEDYLKNLVNSTKGECFSNKNNNYNQ